MSEDERRDDFRRFLRERRARITPEEAGLPPGRRRRVSGLRREEVATIAGIGVSWYTSLENGDARNVSATTIVAVADALRLDESERQHLMALAGLPRAASPLLPSACTIMSSAGLFTYETLTLLISNTVALVVQVPDEPSRALLLHR